MPRLSSAEGRPQAADLSVVIVTYNSVEFIDDCIGSVVRAAQGHDVDIIVVDNASLDGSGEHVESNWPAAHVVYAGWNSGFSRACNLGASLSNAKRLLFLNGDATLHPEAFRWLFPALDDTVDVGVVAPRVLNPDGTDQGTARSFPTASALFFGRRSPLTKRFPNNRFSRRYLSGADPKGDDPFPVDWVSGAALMISRDLFVTLGGFDESFFMYWEDADLCRRVRDLGYEVLCVPLATAVHAEGSSAAVTSPTQNRRFHQSAYRYIAKHHASGPAVVARPAVKAMLAARRGAVTASQWRNQRASLDTRSAPVQGGAEHGHVL